MDLLNEATQNRPRLLNFRNARSPSETAVPQASAALAPEQLTYREPGQYPRIHPEMDGVTPMEYRQHVIERETAKAREYADRKSTAMAVNKIGSVYTMDPPKINNPASNLLPNVYNSSVKFR